MIASESTFYCVLKSANQLTKRPRECQYKRPDVLKTVKNAVMTRSRWMLLGDIPPWKYARAAPQMQSLYDWIQTQMKTLSRHSDTAKAFAYLVQWDGLNVYYSNNNIAETALRGVAVGRKNWLFVGSDSGGERAAMLYLLIGTCRLNNV